MVLVKTVGWAYSCCHELATLMTGHKFSWDDEVCKLVLFGIPLKRIGTFESKGAVLRCYASSWV